MQTGKMLLPTAYLPHIGYILLLKAYPDASIEIHETFPRQTWRNRCRIYTANGLLDMSIPVKRPRGNHTMTRDVWLSSHLPWRKMHWHTIVSAYAKSPYFIYYSDLFSGYFLEEDSQSLFHWNTQLLRVMLEEFQIPTEIKTTSDFLPPVNHPHDFRYIFSPKPSLADWSQHFLWPPYTQVFHEKFGFKPNLSCIDLLFNLGPEAADYLELCLEKYRCYVPQDRQS